MFEDISRFSFGVTAAITTSMAIITGLDAASNSRLAILSALLIIAIADNMSDSLGIHIYRESQITGTATDARIHTVTNFLARFAVTMVFIALVVALPLEYSVIMSVAFGLSLLTFLSYRIALKRETNPYKEILQHLAIAIVVITISHFVGQWISMAFNL